MGTTVYDEVELEDCEFDEDQKRFFYPCPCGDRFTLSLDELLDGEDIAGCPSCSLKIRIIYDEEDLDDYADREGT